MIKLLIVPELLHRFFEGPRIKFVWCICWMRQSPLERTGVFCSYSSQRFYTYFSSSVSCWNHFFALIFLDWCLGNSKCSDVLTIVFFFFRKKYQQKSLWGHKKIFPSLWSALHIPYIYEGFPAGKQGDLCWCISSIYTIHWFYQQLKEYISKVFVVGDVVFVLANSYFCSTEQVNWFLFHSSLSVFPHFTTCCEYKEWAILLTASRQQIMTDLQFIIW